MAMFTQNLLGLESIRIKYIQIVRVNYTAFISCMVKYFFTFPNDAVDRRKPWKKKEIQQLKASIESSIQSTCY